MSHERVLDITTILSLVYLQSNYGGGGLYIEKHQTLVKSNREKETRFRSNHHFKGSRKVKICVSKQLRGERFPDVHTLGMYVSI